MGVHGNVVVVKGQLIVMVQPQLLELVVHEVGEGRPQRPDGGKAAGVAAGDPQLRIRAREIERALDSYADVSAENVSHRGRASRLPRLEAEHHVLYPVIVLREKRVRPRGRLG